ncbi:MAG: hypothetical protein WCG23_09005 [bacterium]
MFNNYTIQRNKPSFSAHIKMCSYSKIEKYLESGIEVSGGYNAMYNIAEASYGKKIGTRRICDCNAVSIFGKNTVNNLVMHLCPDDESIFGNLAENLIALGEKFRNTVNLLKQEGIKPEGLIFGGNYRYPKSKELTVILKYFLEKVGINPTIFAGTEGSKNIFYQGNLNTWMTNIKNIEKNEKSHVMKAFDYIRVAPEDVVEFSDIKVKGTDESLKKGHIGFTIHDVLNKYVLDPETVLKQVNF